MATAAEAATEAASAPADATTEITTEVSGQADQELPASGGAATEVAAKPKQTSEVVRLAREKRALERRVAELTASAKPATADKPVTKDAIVAELRKQYEEDPEAFLEEVAGEDFVTMAGRVAKRVETAKAPATKIEALEKEVRDLKAKYEGDTSAKASAEATAQAQQHVALIQKEIEATGEDGEPRYPTLATLDAEALDEPPSVTAYKAVRHAFEKECMKDGKVVKRWSEAEQDARFRAAFAALERHYGKLRTPKTPNTPRAEEPEPSPTISKSTSSGTADTPVRRASGTLTVQEALRQALKEHGLNH